jgi:CheY-like chemotaxis protein
MAAISVLLVDDHQDSRDVFATILRYHGYTVTEASGGEDAVRLARTALPGVVVTDLNMPGMDGASLIRVLRCDRDFAAVPILVVTADTTEEARREALSAGCSAFVLKPLTPRSFIAAVQALSPTDAATLQTA